MSFTLKLKTFWRLGPANVVQVGLYRLGLRTGLHPVVRLKREIGGSNFFALPEAPLDLPVTDAWRDETLLFGWRRTPLSGSPPSWHQNPFTDQEAGGQDQPWWKIPDFGGSAGDIKCVWEASRFDWVLAMAQRAAAGDSGELTRLNAWLSDWCRANPAYLGVNWKCGQEASIRVMHLALAARLLGQEMSPLPDLVRLIEAHLARIQPTVSYAMAQDNNHGTSEAAALFIGGSLCAAAGLPRGQAWAAEGRKWLENRADRLIAPDGSFSQYSVNYHRLMLDTFGLAELWRRWHRLPEFSQGFQEQARAAAEWLFHLVDPETGSAPNLGANDGANLLPLTGADFTDHRPAVQLAMALFTGKLAYRDGGYHQTHLEWLKVSPPGVGSPSPESRHFADGGYSVLRRGPWTALLNYPRYRFRPSQCDALHLDLWRDGVNLLRDAGTYSYNAEAPWLGYFPGTTAHNTVSFDDHDQMPKVSRFLLGAWLEAEKVVFTDEKDIPAAASAGYTDWWGCRHLREIFLDESTVVIRDHVSGFARRSVLRWRLAPGDWELSGDTLRGQGIQLRVSADVEILRMRLVEGWESRYYLKKSEIQVLEVELSAAGELTTEIIDEESGSPVS